MVAPPRRLRSPSCGIRCLRDVPGCANGGYRIDARPAEGFAGSDLGLVQAQLLDEYDVDYAVLTPMQPQTFGAEAPGLAEALCRACNDWTREEWLDRIPRLLGSICPPHEHPDLAVAEIERLAGDERFVQVLLPGTIEQGLGNRRYWPILRAATDAGLPVALYPGGLAQPKGAGLACLLPGHARAARDEHGGPDALDDLLGRVRGDAGPAGASRSRPGSPGPRRSSWTMDDAWRAFGETATHGAAPPPVGVPARALVVHDAADRGARRSRAPRPGVRRAGDGRQDRVLQRLPALGLRRAVADAAARLHLPGGQGAGFLAGTPVASTISRADDCTHAPESSDRRRRSGFRRPYALHKLAHTAPGADGGLPALEPGETHTFTLAQGDVLQLVTASPDDCDDDVHKVPGGAVHYCKVGKDYDLTGTRISATGKVSVISGHDCAFVPFNRHACDHVEETMFPLEAWGKSSYVSISEQIKCQPTIPNLVRVYSETDGNEIGFVPNDVHDPATLDRGEYLEFEAKKDFYVSGSHAIMVAQFLLGQEYHGLGTAGSFTKGDPSLSLAVPYEQWRNRYSFLAPESFKDNFVNVIGLNGQVVLLDGRLVSGFTPIDGTKMATARVPISGGEHRVESPQPVGIVVYGYAPYTSYMMPGGLDLTPINGLD